VKKKKQKKKTDPASVSRLFCDFFGWFIGSWLGVLVFFGCGKNLERTKKKKKKKKKKVPIHERRELRSEGAEALVKKTEKKGREGKGREGNRTEQKRRGKESGVVKRWSRRS